MEYKNEHDQVEISRVQNLRQDIQNLEMKNTELLAEVEDAEKGTEALLERLCELYDALNKMK